MVNRASNADIASLEVHAAKVLSFLVVLDNMDKLLAPVAGLVLSGDTKVVLIVRYVHLGEHAHVGLLVNIDISVDPHAHLLSHHGGADRSVALALPFGLRVFPFVFALAVNFPAIVIEVAFDAHLHGVGNEAKAVLDTFLAPLEVGLGLFGFGFFLVLAIFISLPFVLPLPVVGDIEFFAGLALGRHFPKGPLSGTIPQIGVKVTIGGAEHVVEHKAGHFYF